MQVYHPLSGQCLDADAGSREIYMNPCSDVDSQKWIITDIDKAAVRKDWDEP